MALAAETYFPRVHKASGNELSVEEAIRAPERKDLSKLIYCSVSRCRAERPAPTRGGGTHTLLPVGEEKGLKADALLGIPTLSTLYFK